MRFLLATILFIGHFYSTAAQEKEINWLSMEEAMEKYNEQPKPIILDAFTDWCGWCKRLDATTFSDPNIIEYVNRNFYAVKFEADTKDTITFQGKDYVNSQPNVPKVPNQRAPMHNFGRYLGISSFPTIVYFDKNLNPNPAPGYMNAKDIQSILVFFAEDVYSYGVPYDTFLDLYKKSFYPQEVEYTPKVTLKKYGLEEALELQKKEPKKIILDLRGSYKLTSRMMPTTFEDSVIASYINEKYYLVEFDVLTQDTVRAFGGKFYVDSLSKPFNGLAVALLEAKMNNIPAIFFIDENQQLIERINSYLTPKNLEPILKFYGEDAYKTVAWPEYRKSFVGEL